LIGTIRDNIAAGAAPGDKPPSDEQVFTAARAARADEFIRELPDGYNTIYSGESIQMSGGQIQRIAIARALIGNPAILLLDEATSALDNQSEKCVQETLANIRQEMKITTVTIAHRLSTIIDSDQIAVISDGDIAEKGTHAELFHRGAFMLRFVTRRVLRQQAMAAETPPRRPSSAVL
jgi:ABC-type multidrug transport system fused ATPase/permease subunit